MPLQLETRDWLNLLDVSRNGLVAVNLDGEIVFLNRTAARIIAIDAEMAIGKRIEALIPNTGLLEVMKSGRDETNQKMVINGHVVFANRIVIKRGGKVTGALGMFQDISELEDLSKELESVRAISRELDCIFESVDDGLVLTDENGVVLRVNKAYQTMVGISNEEYRGKHVHDLIKEGYIGRSVSDIVIQRKSPYSIIDIRNGRELLLTANPVFDENGNVMRVVTATRDLTELSDLKDRLAKSEAARDQYYQELKQFRAELPHKTIVTNNPAVKQKIDLALHIAQVDSNVLILGESGVGKDLFARLIHRASKRALKPFVEINCGTVPEGLLESEFFGYEPGAFTGALKEGKRGLFELAQGGTLFLDEVGELPISLQAKILRAVQSKQISKIGSTKNITLDIRIIAATNRDLEKMIDEKTFRRDLYYRLSVVPIELPPLRDRKEDVLPLITAFLLKFNSRYGYQKWIHPDVIDCLKGYEWPGNIRELENAVERAVVTSLDDCMNLDAFSNIPNRRCFDGRAGLTSLRQTREKQENQVIAEAYRNTGSTRKTAKLLGISQSAVVKKMQKYGISKK
ncbi:MAG: sigma-54 interaction domain-containing protein [Desulfomonilaceae bacterium]